MRVPEPKGNLDPGQRVFIATLIEIPWSTEGSNEDENGNETACGSCSTRRRNDRICDDRASGFGNDCRQIGERGNHEPQFAEKCGSSLNRNAEWKETESETKKGFCGADRQHTTRYMIGSNLVETSFSSPGGSDLRWTDRFLSDTKKVAQRSGGYRALPSSDLCPVVGLTGVSRPSLPAIP